jgi:hypothetical protein
MAAAADGGVINMEDKADDEDGSGVDNGEAESLLMG